jgi:hypothetical protein
VARLDCWVFREFKAWRSGPMLIGAQVLRWKPVASRREKAQGFDVYSPVGR